MTDIKVWPCQGSLCWHPSLWDSNDLIWVGYSMIFYFVCIPSCLANSGSSILAVPVRISSDREKRVGSNSILSNTRLKLHYTQKPRGTM